MQGLFLDEYADLVDPTIRLIAALRRLKSEFYCAYIPKNLHPHVIAWDDMKERALTPARRRALYVHRRDL